MLHLLLAATLSVTAPDAFDLHNVKADVVTFQGKRALHVLQEEGTAEPMVTLRESDFGDGTIETDIAGAPRAGSAEGARGFVGIAFRMKDLDHYECFYLRPTNGRADDQLRRNHATQYVSAPDWPWQRLRKEFPGVYESYVDLEPAKWTHVRIVVKGTRAELYVNRAAQPCLIVKDLKLGESRGGIALWIGLDTEAYFSDVSVK